MLFVPSWPLEFSPQHTAAPVARTEQLLSSPADTRAASASPTTATGIDVFSGSTATPSPSWVDWLLPQQYAAPLDSAAQAWSLPASIETTPARPATDWGEDSFIGGGGGSPSCGGGGRTTALPTCP